MVVTNLDDLATLIRARRTHLLVEPDREVPAELVARLCELGTWAPCHKKTWPWKFAHLTGDARYRLGEAFVADMIARDFGDEGKRAKTLTKFGRAPSILVVGCEPHDNPTLHDENRDAVAAAVQNILLGATAAGLASFWATPPLNDSRRALELCGFGHADRLIGVLYLGWPNRTVETPTRPVPRIAHIS